MEDMERSLEDIEKTMEDMQTSASRAGRARPAEGRSIDEDVSQANAPRSGALRERSFG